VNIRNLSDAILDRKAASQGSLATDVAALTFPGSQNAQRAANIVDLTTDLVTGLGARQAIAGRIGQLDRFAMERAYLTDPTDMGRVVEIMQGLDTGWTMLDAGKDILGNFPSTGKKKCP